MEKLNPMTARLGRIFSMSFWSLFEKKNPSPFVEVGPWRMERGPQLREFKVSRREYDDAGQDFAAVLRANGIDPRYKPGQGDAGISEEINIIEIGKPFTYVDWRGPWVWKIYEESGGRFDLRAVLHHKTSKEEALAEMKRLAGA
jgi:hypothetical protein